MQSAEVQLSWIIPDDNCHLHLQLTLESTQP
jgi:hypothetical protein